MQSNIVLERQLSDTEAAQDIGVNLRGAQQDGEIQVFPFSYFMLHFKIIGSSERHG